MADAETKIIVDHVSKNFRVYKDKSHTLKDKVLFSGRNSYQLHKVLDDVSFSVGRGEAVGLIGHNGCGKSTTLKLLNRILYPDEGKIITNGKISSLIELGAGFHPDMSGRENIYINGSIFGLKKKEIDARFSDIVRFSELEKFIDNPVRTYSSGMYMRLAFSVAINVNADILLIDEILAVGDANFQTKCFNRLRQIKENGAAIVIVSHSMEQIKSICDKTIWLDEGKIRESGPSAEVTGDYLFSMKKEADKRARIEAEEKGELTSDKAIEIIPPQKSSLQCCPHAVRRGNMTAVVSEFVMRDSNGQMTQNFTYDQPLHIFFTLTEEQQKVQHRNDGIVIIQFFSNKTGNLCASFNSYNETNQYLTDLPGKYQFTIENLDLVDGDYFITIHIKHGEILTDSIWHFVDFHVTAPNSVGEGVCAMKNKLEKGERTTAL